MSKQLTIFDAVGDKKSVSPTTELGDTKKQAIERYLARGKTPDLKPALEPAICIKQYSPNGRKTKYFRLDYRVGRKVNSKHIPGGSVKSPLAQYRARELQKLIDRGAPLGEILAQVATFHQN